MRTGDVFDILFLIGRPASGKSEIIDFLKKIPCDERRSRFHLGTLYEIDDFPMIWSWFEEDAILSRNSLPSLHNDEEGYFRHKYFWNILIQRLELEYWKKSKEPVLFGETHTAIIEFARGTEHGGFREAFSQFTSDLLTRAAAMYIDVTFDESLRKNRQRSNPEKPHSILEHALPDEKLRTLYEQVDWEEFCAADPQYLHLSNVQPPYIVFANSDDVTTGDNPLLAIRLEQVLGKLWNIYRNE